MGGVHHLQGDPQHQLHQDVERHVEQPRVDQAVAQVAPDLTIQYRPAILTRPGLPDTFCWGCISSRSSKGLGRTENTVNTPDILCETHQANIIDLLQAVEHEDEDLTETEQEHEQRRRPAAVLVLNLSCLTISRCDSIFSQSFIHAYSCIFESRDLWVLNMGNQYKKLLQLSL